MRPYKAAVIGLGKIGLLYDFEPGRARPASHVLAYADSPQFDLVCAVDGDISRRDSLRRAAVDTAFYPSLDAALASRALDGVDVVSICTPPQSHYELLLRLMEGNIGRVIFCEKPLVSGHREAALLRKLSGTHPEAVVVPNISRRWNPGLREVSRTVASGEYGALQKIQVRYVGFREEGRRRDAIYKAGAYHNVIEYGILNGENELK